MTYMNREVSSVTKLKWHLMQRTWYTISLDDDGKFDEEAHFVQKMNGVESRNVDWFWIFLHLFYSLTNSLSKGVSWSCLICDAIFFEMLF